MFRWLVAWLEGSCEKPSERGKKDEGVVKSVVTIGTQTAHHTHDINLFDSGEWKAWWCSKCGNVGMDHAKALASPCTNYMKQAGLQNIARLKKGHMPGSSAAARAHNAMRSTYKPKPRKGAREA